MKFYVDVKRCIECGGCEVACKNENNVPMGIARIRVVTVNEGQTGETNVPIPCMHCTNAPCISVCPVDALFTRADGIVHVNKETCIGCGYCGYACPFGVPQYPSGLAFGQRGVMDKCTFCAGGPEKPLSDRERLMYGSNRVAEGKLPLCASVCATKALVAGDAVEVEKVVRQRVATRGYGESNWGWSTAYPTG
ncbi:MAG: 4Fe-4S dicluster domain-containing protein [Candidatus Lambdaproteobacteria bacterium]|nr:4Fe-4S dicluster domain-containing protein [Candidatus Lambdaproteobacteria bacterium]